MLREFAAGEAAYWWQLVDREKTSSVIANSVQFKGLARAHPC